MRKDSFSTIVNRSLNQTLGRTLITSLTTLFVILMLFVFGGKVLNDFAFALLVGIIVGTYSSDFIVAPLVLDWEIKKPSKKRG
jgi:preprotein translocase subunit SecF